MSGIRIGTLYSENTDLVEAMAKLGPFHGISGITQHQVAQLLQDRGILQMKVSHMPKKTFCRWKIVKKRSPQTQ